MSASSLQKHSRRPSWPTLQLLTPNSMSSKSKPVTTASSTSTTTTPPSEDIDEDPFSHFLSPVMDEDDPFDGLEYSAGIHTFDDEEEVESKRTKFRARLEEKWGNFLSSRRTSSPNKETSPPRTPPDEDALPELVLDDLEGFGSPSSSPPNLPTVLEGDEEDATDGWAADRRRLRRKNNFSFEETKTKTERPRFRRVKTLSGRPHSFVEPSPHLWTVEEAEEEKERAFSSSSSSKSRPEFRGRRWSRA